MITDQCASNALMTIEQGKVQWQVSLIITLIKLTR